MASVTITIPNPVALDVLAGLEQAWRGETINLYFGGVPAGYDSLTATEKAQACLRAVCHRAYTNFKRRQAEQAILPPPDPGIT